MSPPAWLPPLNSHSDSSTSIRVEQHKPPSRKVGEFFIDIDASVSYDFPVNFSDPFLGLNMSSKASYSYELLASSPSQFKTFISSVLSYLRLSIKLDHVKLHLRHLDGDAFSSLESAESFLVRIHEFLVSMRNKSYNAGHKWLPLRLKIKKVVSISDDEYKAWTTWYKEKQTVDPKFKRNYRKAISRPRTVEELLYEETLTFKPTTQSAIKKLKDVRVDDSNSTPDCLVCLEELEHGAKGICLPCSHVFHRDCILKWLQESHICPLCRYMLPTGSNV